MRLCVLLALAASLGCAAELPSSDSGLPSVRRGADGKADNYISTNAREIVLSGTAHFVLPDGLAEMDDAAKTAALEAAAAQRLSTVSSAIRSHIDGVLRMHNGETSGEDAKYFIFVKRSAGETESAEVADATYGRFRFRLELVGSNEVMDLVAPAPEEGERTFQVQVSGLVGMETEPVTVTVRPTASVDAFPRYDALFEDGVYDVGVHFGGDYNTERYDIETAKWFVEYLVEQGFTNPSAMTFEALRIDSPPFTKALVIEGRPVEARIYVYHSDMVEATDETPLRTRMEESFAERDVVVYSGHAGPGSGFILDYQPRFEIPASDFATVPMADKYQIFLFDGCQTYRTYVDDLMKNPSKTFENVDIITTVNTTPFSAGYQTLHELVQWLTITDEQGNHFPMSWAQILRGINTEEFRNVYYGVHGIDADPRINPNGHEGVACMPCETDADCAGGGNFCLEDSGQKRCGVACTTDEACGAGFTCAEVFDGDEQWYLPRQCVPTMQGCGG